MSEIERLYCPPPDLDWSQPGGPRAQDYGDIYFSVDDGLEETKSVFLKSCGLPERWQGRDQFVVAELGFGTGLNFLSLWQLWREHRQPGQRLHFVTLEGRPLTRLQIERAWQDWPQLSHLSEKLLPLWPTGHKGPHRIRLDDDAITLSVFHDEAEAALRDMDFAADAWFLDGFAPAKNPHMWSQAVFDQMARLSAPGALVGTFTVAGAVRRGLAAAGFTVRKQPGFGRKRERLEAIFEQKPTKTDKTPFLKPQPETGRILIIGGGIAAASLVHAAKARGRDVQVIAEGGWASGASSAPLGLLTPRLEAGDRPHQRLCLAAFYFARRLYQGIENAFFPTGVLRLAKDETSLKRLTKIADMMGEGYEILTSEKASQQVGKNLDHSGLWMADAGYFKPEALVHALAQGVDALDENVARLNREGGLWQALNPAGEIIAEGETVILAGGAYLGGLDHDSVRPSLGQSLVFPGSDDKQAAPITWGGYSLSHKDQHLIGATHEKGETFLAPDEVYEALISDAEIYLKDLDLNAETAQIWQGKRAVTPDHLPILGPVLSDRYPDLWRAVAMGQAPAGELQPDEDREPSLYYIGALGSRGFAHAPLLAESLMAYLCAEPSAIAVSEEISINTARFAWRSLKRGAL